MWEKYRLKQISRIAFRVINPCALVCGKIHLVSELANIYIHIYAICAFGDDMMMAKRTWRRRVTQYAYTIHTSGVLMVAYRNCIFSMAMRHLGHPASVMRAMIVNLLVLMTTA